MPVRDSKKPSRPPLRKGAIAILDALGAAAYSPEKIYRFLNSRALAFSLVQKKLDRLNIAPDDLRTFTFGDTVILAYETRNDLRPGVKAFTGLLRQIVVKSLENGIMFRGAFSIGDFIADDNSNSVLGEAVTDAAAWYDKAEWLGVAATPRASSLVRSAKLTSGDAHEQTLLPYQVPLKGDTTMDLEAVNWPKGFFVRGVQPQACADGEKPLAVCLRLLATDPIPVGAEKKLQNSIAFFSHCDAHYQEQRRRAKK